MLLIGKAQFDNLTVIIVGLISGALWAFGQGNQLRSISLIGVSKTMPISTGMQLLVLHYLVLFSWRMEYWYSSNNGNYCHGSVVTGIALTSLRGKMKENRMIQNLRKQC